jgi:hypothetical protein
MLRTVIRLVLRSMDIYVAHSMEDTYTPTRKAGVIRDLY